MIFRILLKGRYFKSFKTPLVFSEGGRILANYQVGQVDADMKYVSGNWGNENCLIDGNFTSNYFSCFFSPTGKSYTKQLD